MHRHVSELGAGCKRSAVPNKHAVLDRSKHPALLGGCRGHFSTREQTGGGLGQLERFSSRQTSNKLVIEVATRLRERVDDVDDDASETPSACELVGDFAGKKRVDFNTGPVGMPLEKADNSGTLPETLWLPGQQRRLDEQTGRSVDVPLDAHAAGARPKGGNCNHGPRLLSEPIDKCCPFPGRKIRDRLHPVQLHTAAPAMSFRHSLGSMRVRGLSLERLTQLKISMTS